MTDPLGQSQVIPYLAGLTKFGYRFTILSCEKPKNYFLLKDEIENLLDLFSIKWVPVYYHKTPPVLSTIYDVYQLKKEARRLHSEEKFDIVHTRPGVPALIGLWMKKKFGLKFLNDIREFYADSRLEGNIWDKRKFIHKKIYDYFKRKEKEEVEISDGIVCLTYVAEKIIKGWPYYKNEIPLQVIPCSVDMNLFDPQKINTSLQSKLKSELNIHDNDFIISYLGSIGSWYLTDEMMQFFKFISDHISNARFLFISPEEHNTISIKANEFGLQQDKIILRKAKRTEIPGLLSLSKFSVFFIKPCYSKQSSSPTKHGEIMAMGIPLITNAGVGDVGYIVDKYQSGIVLQEFNLSAYQSAVSQISEKFLSNQNEIRMAAGEFYNLDKAIEKYHKIYNQILA